MKILDNRSSLDSIKESMELLFAKYDKLSEELRKEHEVLEKELLTEKVLKEQVDAKEREYIELLKKEHALLKDIDSYQMQLNKIETSKTWKLTVPIRKVSSLFKYKKSK